MISAFTIVHSLAARRSDNPPTNLDELGIHEMSEIAIRVLALVEESPPLLDKFECMVGKYKNGWHLADGTFVQYTPRYGVEVECVRLTVGRDIDTALKNGETVYAQALQARKDQLHKKILGDERLRQQFIQAEADGLTLGLQTPFKITDQRSSPDIADKASPDDADLNLKGTTRTASQPIQFKENREHADKICITNATLQLMQLSLQPSTEPITARELSAVKTTEINLETYVEAAEEASRTSTDYTTSTSVRFKKLENIAKVMYASEIVGETFNSFLTGRITAVADAVIASHRRTVQPESPQELVSDSDARDSQVEEPAK